MKSNCLKFFIPVLMIAGLCACSEPEPQDFTAEFYTTLAGMEPSDQCEGPHALHNTQKGDGTASFMGNFTTTMTFCVDTTTLQYVNGEGSLVAENGDEVFLRLAEVGQIKPTEKEGYDLEFMDPFEITGGTGQFEGATGSGITNSYVNMNTQRTDHNWKGIIAIPK